MTETEFVATEFIPSAVSCDVSAKLTGFLAEMRGLLQHRGSAIAADNSAARRVIASGSKVTVGASTSMAHKHRTHAAASRAWATMSSRRCIASAME